MMSTDEGGENELVFFRRLDDEFNKVNEFYRKKVEEVMQEAELLNKQMETLVAFRIKVENPRRSDWALETTRLASDVAASDATVAYLELANLLELKFQPDQYLMIHMAMFIDRIRKLELITIG
ncbi:hypothetical protein Sjap_015611 [Stephania japonica]|uniref:SPX domain-containing protein n=1 Tax=Stephania japonica TaxID=461633 RepID=A0AAP0NSN9_9MAGN